MILLHLHSESSELHLCYFLPHRNFHQMHLKYFSRDRIQWKIRQRGLINCLVSVLGLQEYLEKYLDEKTPALILVPVVNLPGKEVIHIACWLS